MYVKHWSFEEFRLFGIKQSTYFTAITTPVNTLALHISNRRAMDYILFYMFSFDLFRRAHIKLNNSVCVVCKFYVYEGMFLKFAELRIITLYIYFQILVPFHRFSRSIYLIHVLVVSRYRRWTGEYHGRRNNIHFNVEHIDTA